MGDREGWHLPTDIQRVFRSPQRELGGARATGAPPNSRCTALEHGLKRARDWCNNSRWTALEHGVGRRKSSTSTYPQIWLQEPPTSVGGCASDWGTPQLTLGALEHRVGRLLITALDATNPALLLTHKSGYRSPQRQLGGARETGAPPNSRCTALEEQCLGFGLLCF